MEVKQRNSSFELLRILCILLIIASHYYTHGGGYETISTFNSNFLKCVGIWGKFGVNVFVLITGYFGSKIKAKRIIPLIEKRWLVAVIISIIFAIGGLVVFSKKFVFQTIFPILSLRHHYISVFIILMLFVPFINKGLAVLSQKAHLLIIILATIFISIIPTVYPAFSVDTYCYLFWMIYLFIIGRYLSEYDPKLLYLFMLVVSVVVALVCVFLVEPNIGLYPLGYFWSNQYSFVLLVGSVGLLGIFSHIQMKSIRIINMVGKTTLFVYLIHDDPLVRGVIWKDVFQNYKYGESNFLVLHFIITILIVYVSCVLIGLLFDLTIGNILKKIPTKRLEYALDKFYGEIE